MEFEEARGCLTPRPDSGAGGRGRGRSGSRNEVSHALDLLLLLPTAPELARVPGIGLLNRTLKSWVERHGVRFLRGRPDTGLLPCLLLLIKSGVAQAGESARLINERVRVQLPPPRPKFIRGYDLTG